ncbi:MORN-repeat protein [Orpheovirus IHUMI-LCC2]|uniref:MORN-repeat protein n=1 Tax=Orpheovirus IHUMI-LCC2 TaxID=2023057 RepID=A0A2I2L3H8_9VIRU|nr:MORN-repeat protein [Orpheovirus IHUMI-LCC2]SNW62086.1 MORN-repeat protein [Orpheovirus IHUMI-LCC2]
MESIPNEIIFYNICYIDYEVSKLMMMLNKKYNNLSKGYGNDKRNPKLYFLQYKTELSNPSNQLKYWQNIYTGRMEDRYEKSSWGNPKEILYFTDGVQNGKCTYINDGTEEYMYVNGLKNGKYRKFNIWGNLVEEGTYKDNKLNGSVSRYHGNGKKFVECTYIDNNLFGTYKEFNDKGIIIEQYDDNIVKINDSYKSVKSGKYNKYDNRGRRIQECYYVGDDEKLDGKYIKWYPSKRINSLERKMMEEYYKNGHRYGKSQKWYENGNIHIQCSYNERGILIGEYKELYVDGSIRKQCHYAEIVPEDENVGVLHGKYLEYNNNNKLIKRGFYINGKLDGKYMERNTVSNTKIKCIYKNGILHGQCAEYYVVEEPIQIKLSTYKDGQLDGIYIERYDNGDKKLECYYKENKLDGKYELFHSRVHVKIGGIVSSLGQVMMRIKCFYKEGKLHGQYEEWSPNGTQNIKCFYENGIKL